MVVRHGRASARRSAPVRRSRPGQRGRRFGLQRDHKGTRRPSRDRPGETARAGGGNRSHVGANRDESSHRPCRRIGDGRFGRAARHTPHLPSAIRFAGDGRGKVRTDGSDQKRPVASFFRSRLARSLPPHRPTVLRLLENKIEGPSRKGAVNMRCISFKEKLREYVFR